MCEKTLSLMWSKYVSYLWQDKTLLCAIHTATHCNTLQHTATHCNTLQHTATRQDSFICHTTFSFNARMCRQCMLLYVVRTATHCNTLQHTATHCNKTRLFYKWYALQHTATHCNTLQHTATHCKKTRLFYTWYDSFMCATTHSLMWAQSLSHVWQDSISCVTVTCRRSQICDSDVQTLSYVWQDSFICDCDMQTLSCMTVTCRLFICVIWPYSLVYVWPVWHASHVSHVSRVHMWHLTRFLRTCSHMTRLFHAWHVSLIC